MITPKYEMIKESDNAQVYGRSTMCDKVMIAGNAVICDTTHLHGKFTAWGNSHFDCSENGAKPESTIHEDFTFDVW